VAEGLILEFDGVDESHYHAVNSALGIDAPRGTGDWPAGLLFHAGAAKPGGLVVFEVWDSKESQGRFMEERLMPALQAGGVTSPPSRVEWVDVLAYQSLG
jgi:hypothetical protein